MAEQGETLKVPAVTTEEPNHGTVKSNPDDEGPSAGDHQHSHNIFGAIHYHFSEEFESKVDALFHDALGRVHNHLSSVFETKLEAAKSEFMPKPSVESTPQDVEKTPQTQLDGETKDDNGSVVEPELVAETSEGLGMHVSDLIPHFIRDFFDKEVKKVKAMLWFEMLTMLEPVGDYAFDELRKKFHSEIKKMMAEKLETIRS